MAGRKQHHIPRMVLRGFLIPKKGKAEQVRVFSKDKTYVASIDDIAAERHFYSELSINGEHTLDDLITQYEEAFKTKFFPIRDIPIGTDVDPDSASEVVAHLITRNAYMRQSIGSAMRALFDKAVDLFCNEQNIRLMMGVDSNEIPPRIKGYIDEEIAKDARFSAINLPKPILYKVAFMAMKENFTRFLLEYLPQTQIVLQLVARDAPNLMRRSHNEMLTENLVSDARVSALRELHWSVAPAQKDGAVLPDCVALGIEPETAWQPLLMTDLKKIDYAVMPLTSEKLLIGCRQTLSADDFVNFNQNAAACSYRFFASCRDGDDLRELTTLIGERTRESVEETITSAFEGFRKEHLPLPEQSTHLLASHLQNQSPAASKEITSRKTMGDYPVSFKGIGDEQAAKDIAATLNVIVAELHELMPLERLDGFTFAVDYETALAELDRGFETREPLRAGKSSYGISVARSPFVLRDGVAKAHVVARMDIATALISDDDAQQKLALHTIVSQLAHVAYVQLIDESLPGILSTPLSDAYEAFLFPWVDTGWSGYFGARASAIFDPSFGKAYVELTTSALTEARREIPAARLKYRFDGNLDHLLEVTLPRIGAILGFTGQLLGHYDGIKQSAFENSDLERLFEEAGLRAWVDLYREDLARVWDHRGRWTSIDEFLVLNRHAERVLWQFGMFPWKNPEGQTRIEIPLVVDAQDLAGIRPAIKSLIWTIRGWASSGFSVLTLFKRCSASPETR